MSILTEENAITRRLEKIEKLRAAWMNRMESARLKRMVEQLERMSLEELKMEMDEIEERVLELMETGDTDADMDTPGRGILEEEDIEMELAEIWEHMETDDEGTPAIRIECMDDMVSEMVYLGSHLVSDMEQVDEEMKLVDGETKTLGWRYVCLSSAEESQRIVILFVFVFV